MRWVIGLLLAGCVIYVAWAMAQKYKKKKNFFEDLYNFCGELESQISFFQNNLSQICEQALNKYPQGEFCELLKTEIEYLKDLDKQKLDEWGKKQSIADESEIAGIIDFFAGLGRVDCETQTLKLREFKSLISVHKERASKENEKRGKLTVKLGVMLGAVVFIISL